MPNSVKGENTMSMWTAIALIAVAGIIASIFRDKGKRQHSAEIKKELESMHHKLDALDAELRERVETLERIVTNPKEDLKRQFEHMEKVS
jgi:phage shock protein B